MGRDNSVGRADVPVRPGYRHRWEPTGSVWVARSKRVGWRFVPDGHTAATAAVRFAAGACVLSLESLAPTATQSWVHLIGRILIIMGAWTLVGHMERTFTSHVRVAGERIWARITGRPVRTLSPTKPDEFA